MKLRKFNCAPKLDEQVNLPTREQVRDVCSYLSPKVVDQVFLVDDLINLVGKFIARKFRVNVLHAKAYEVELGELNINAYYDPERDERNKYSIEIILVTNPNDDYLILDRELWTQFVYRLADSIAHELIHMRQARARDFLYVEHKARRWADIDENLVYLSDPDEIEAYAHNIATELREHDNSIQKLQNPKAVTIVDSVNLWAYINAFSKNINDPVVKKLLKKVYKLLT